MLPGIFKKSSNSNVKKDSNKTGEKTKVESKKQNYSPYWLLQQSTFS